MTDSVHTFSNGLRVFDRHLSEGQKARYRSCNVHEADEEALFLKLLKAVPAAGVFVNVGAAIGYYPILAKRIRPDIIVHALEPLQEHREYMAANMRLNGLPEDSIVIHATGLSTRNGFAILDVQSYNSKLRAPHISPVPMAKNALKRVLTSLRLGSYAIHEQRIEIMSIESLLACMQRPIDLLQMDIQGLEADVLASGVTTLRTGAIKSLLIGTHGEEIHWRCAETVAAAGYTVEFCDPRPAGQPDGILAACFVN
jgi:FkbM family methyltransferase